MLPDPLGVSCDGEKWWGSNYGAELDVVAPGVKIYTTDISSSGGYNTSSGTNGNYYASFGGTSAACPHVAGVAALILSVRPDLDPAHVRQTIESTCTKLSAYTFSANADHPNGTWNNQVGHGLVNAYAAVNAVAPKITGPTVFCSSATFTVTNAPSNYTWTCSANLTPGTASGNSKSFSASGGSGWVAINVGSTEVARHNVSASTGTPSSINVTITSTSTPNTIRAIVSTSSTSFPDAYEWICDGWTNAITGTYPDYAIDPSKVLVSRGVLTPVANAVATAVDGNIVISWDDNSGVGSAKQTDKALIAIVNSAKGEAITDAAGTERTAGAQTVVLPADWSGDEVHVYLGFISEDKKEVANSVYLGAVTVVAPFE